jgi:DNA-binding FadR family transcriptional regulator
VLESTALRFCHARRREEALRQMRAAADAMERARDADDRLGLARADTAFHQAIVENSANEYLVAAYRLVSGRVAALRTHNLMAADSVRNSSLAEHRAVIAAMAKGDIGRAETVLDEHIWRMRLRYSVAQRRPAGESP